MDILSKKTIAIGNLLYDEHEDTNTRLHYGATTVPGANVQFTYNYLTRRDAVADETGLVGIDLDPKANVDFHHVKVFSNYLSYESGVDYTTLGTMELTQYPQNISFGDIAIPSSHTLYNRSDAMKFVVEDSRFVRHGWKLEVRLVTPLIEENGLGRDLSDALVYKGIGENEPSVLTGEKILIYETEDGYDEITEINLAEDEGILLQLFGANGLLAGTSYNAELEWILTSK